MADGAPCPRYVSVTGHAASTQAPDFAEVAVGVEAKGATAGAALDAASKAVAGIAALAREAGLPPADIGTAAVTLRPATRTVTRPGGGITEEPDGYAAGNVVRLRLSDMGRLGDLLRRTLDSGANRIDGITFGLRDPDGATAALQVAAARDARARAATLAEAVGAKLGPLCTLTALEAGPAPFAMRAMAAAAPKARPVPVEAGTIEGAASVTAVFALDP
ncbi:SIMPL domain-containing protein [Methylobacterium sp. J-076]|uniref:SIMPL domain-containing protein n=1 Tax=Methylobacterium sp. J-076 TaxID=2836655 RepID=UPI001FBBE4CF|nr:SIMPL domain-containing protein [Methylobacterium sp. J-076]MCJ2012085.1 SIMPL domain-containing protein [Methylobacterium sp. J-076]